MFLQTFADKTSCSTYCWYSVSREGCPCDEISGLFMLGFASRKSTTYGFVQQQRLRATCVPFHTTSTCIV